MTTPHVPGAVPGRAACSPGCLLRSCLAAWALASLPAAAAHGQLPVCNEGGPDYDIVPLAPLAPGSFSVAAINDAGEVAGRIFPDGGHDDALFLWRDGALSTRSFPGLNVIALGLNDDGVVLGRLFTPGQEGMFLWFARTDEVQMVPSPVDVFPTDLNADLLIVGGDLAGLQGFALDAGSAEFHPIAFGDLPERGVGTQGASAVNGAGLVVGSEVVFLPDEGYFQEVPYTWTVGGGIEALPGVPGGFGGRAVDVNGAGDVAGYVLDEFFGMQTALWIAGEPLPMDLGSPQNFFVSEALAVNAGRQIAVVAPNDLFGFTRAFVWDQGEFTDLSCFTGPLGLFAARPVDINDAGDVLTQLTDEEGIFILDIIILRPVDRGPNADLDGDGVVDVDDLVLLILAWGPCEGACPADLDGDGAVEVDDLVILILDWGPV